MDIVAAGGLAGIAVRFEGRHDRVDIAGRQRTLVLGHDIRLAQLRIGLQQRRAVRVAAGQRPAAEVHPQFLDASVGLAVGDDRDRKVDSLGLTVEVENHLPKAASLGDDVLDVLDRDVAPREPRFRFGGVRLERPRALDPPAYGVVQLGSPANDPTSASNSPAIKPSKNGTVTSSRRRFSSRRPAPVQRTAQGPTASRLP